VDSKLALGLMSGTSCDGVDVALVDIKGKGIQTKVRLVAFDCYPYTAEEREMLLSLARGETGGSHLLCLADVFLGRKFAQSALALCDCAHVEPSRISFIASHGHTFYHLPKKERFLGEDIRGTLQLGEPSYLNEAFHCPVVSDFRVRDMAAGGQGAPLVPYTEYLLYRSETKNIALQNIGGIGNITILPHACDVSSVLAFDTGPGNMIIDQMVGSLTEGKLTYDENGRLGGKGKVDERLLSFMLDDPYISERPPKTTGRERYGASYCTNLIKKAQELGVGSFDLIATVTMFTAKCIAIGLQQFSPVAIDELYINGGGVHNNTLFKDIQSLMGEGTRVLPGDTSDSKEAIAFAILGNETLEGLTNNLCSVTGARHPCILGKISF